MSEKWISVTRLLRRSVNLNYITTNGKVKLDPGRSTIQFPKCDLCTEVRLPGNVPQSVEPAAIAEKLQEKVNKIQNVKGNLCDYADASPLLQNLIDLGVEIYKFNNDQALCKFLMKLNFDNNIKPYLIFLHNNGVPVEKLGDYLTRNPYILMCHLDDLQVRINYLQSKKFTQEMITDIITQHPRWLSYEVTQVDSQLGMVQTTLEMTGDEMRSLIHKFPGIVSVKRNALRLNMFTFKEEFGIELRDCKNLVLKEPRLLKYDNKSIINTLHYLTYNMAVPVHLIIDQPKVLICRSHILNVRHKFLNRLGRAQYNPKMPGYVSLVHLVSYSDEDFCDKIARTSLINFYNFQKTL